MMAICVTVEEKQSSKTRECIVLKQFHLGLQSTSLTINPLILKTNDLDTVSPFITFLTNVTTCGRSCVICSKIRSLEDHVLSNKHNKRSFTILLRSREVNKSEVIQLTLPF